MFARAKRHENPAYHADTDPTMANVSMIISKLVANNAIQRSAPEPFITYPPNNSDELWSFQPETPDFPLRVSLSVTLLAG